VTSHASRLAPHALFITGTDTGVGKTLIACALLRAFAARRLRVLGMKPVAAGARMHDGQLLNNDVEELIAAGNVRAPLDAINPYCFEPAIAPHLAARQAGVEIDIGHIAARLRELAQLADVVIIEGAGGFCVPLNTHETSADLAQRLGAPVVLVVGMRLGCLNHALLTAQAIHARGLEFAGWVANHVDPAMAHANENVSALDRRLNAPLLARIRYAENPDPRTVARNMDLDALPRPKSIT
jgi:dethiobiotin synthetase